MKTYVAAGEQTLSSWSQKERKRKNPQQQRLSFSRQLFDTDTKLSSWCHTKIMLFYAHVYDGIMGV